MKRIGEILVEEFGLASKALEQALDSQKEGDDLIGEILIKNGELDEFTVLQVLGIMFDMEVRKSLPSDIKTDFTDQVPISFLKQHKIVPIVTGDESFFAIMIQILFSLLMICGEFWLMKLIKLFWLLHIKFLMRSTLPMI